MREKKRIKVCLPLIKLLVFKCYFGRRFHVIRMTCEFLSIIYTKLTEHTEGDNGLARLIRKLKINEVTSFLLANCRF